MKFFHTIYLHISYNSTAGTVYFTSLTEWSFE